jgi:hypothetical protein
MDWFGFLFLAAFIYSAFSGKAYFRGVVRRKDDPRQYWSIVACYLVLASFMSVLPAIRGFRGVHTAYDSFRYFLTDAATRAAGEIADGVRHGQTKIELRMRPTPEGCAADYKLQLSKQSALVIWCIDPITKSVTSSHTTTSHLAYVDVPQTFIVEKHAGELVTIELSGDGGKSTVTDVR